MSEKKNAQRKLARDSIEQRGPGPYARAALFCDQVIQGEDKANTLIRVFDQLTSGIEYTVEGPDSPPDDFLKLSPALNASLFISLMYLDREVDRDIFILMQKEGNEERVEIGDIHVEPSGKLRGSTIRVNVTLSFPESGTYLFDVVSGDRVLTTTALEVDIERNVTVVTRPEAPGSPLTD